MRRTTLFIVAFSISVSGCDLVDKDTFTELPTDSDEQNIEQDLLDCSGGKADPTTSLCWQNPPSDEIFVIQNNALNYCENLVHGEHSNWRLPTIEELTSLIRGCDCTVNDPACYYDATCDYQMSCDSCNDYQGPGNDGCYWDPALEGECSNYWSSSARTNNGPSNVDDHWNVHFNNGTIWNHIDPMDYYARCVSDI